LCDDGVVKEFPSSSRRPLRRLAGLALRLQESKTRASGYLLSVDPTVVHV
jgi:hypothetical protein